MAEFWNLTGQIADTGLPGGSPGGRKIEARGCAGRLIPAHLP